MKHRLHNKTRNVVVADAVEEAKAFFARLQGLLGRDSLAEKHALWLEPCNSIHTFFMRFPIDAVFVDTNLVVRRVVKNVKPWRLITPVAHAHSVFELAAGQISDGKVQEGDQLYVGD